MHDDRLRELLGWSSCIKDSNWCTIHGVWSPGSGEMCGAQRSDLDRIREGMALVTPVLTDLIADLREVVGDSDDEWSRVVVGDAADRAEARLREVTGDE